jgi:tetratricopeptide (TPR) repeat protein
MGRVALQRMIVVVAAALVAGWLAISYRNFDRVQNAAFLAGAPRATPSQFENALESVRSAGTLNPRKAEALSVEAALELRLQRPAAAIADLEEIVRREPRSLEAWFLIAQIDRSRDPARAAYARAQFRRLDPIEARRRHF